MRKRDVFVKIRTTEEEKAAWQKQAEDQKMTLADLVRRRLGDSQPVDREPKKTRSGRKKDTVLLSNIGRVGSNLNQIAKWANTYKDAAEAAEVLLALVAIEQHLSEISSAKKFEPILAKAKEDGNAG